MKPSVDTDFTVVVTGAGISFDAPSSLPSAGDLADELWDGFCDSLDGVVDATLAATVRQRFRSSGATGLPAMRMEQFMELLTKPGTVPVSIVVDIYRLVAGAAYNENHLRLAAMRTRHFTLNMDTLIEDAGDGVDIVHLHGRWDEPEQIRTTVAHYSRGLDRDLRDAFCAAIEDATVLVIGYCGRDPDGVPLFDLHPPRRLVWVGPNLDGWEYEAVELRHRYDRGDFGTRRHFEAVEMTAGEYLPSLVPTVPVPSGAVAAHPPPCIRERLERETSFPQRLIALGNLLFDLGLFDDLHQVLRTRRFRGRDEIMRRKLVARSLTRQGSPEQAFALLARWPRGPAQVGPWLRAVTEIDALPIDAVRPRAARVFWKAVLAVMVRVRLPGFERARLLAQVRRAKSLSLAGRPWGAVALSREVTRRDDAAVVLGQDVLVDSLTWQADQLKVVGALNDARESAMRADRLGFYGNPSQAAFAKWKLGEVMAAAGRLDGEPPTHHRQRLMDLFGGALSLAEQVDNRDALAWIHGTCAEVWAGFDLAKARRHIAAATAAGALSSRRSAYGRCYHLLQRAVVEREAGQYLVALSHLGQALEVEDGRIPSAHLQARQLREELLWLQDPTHDLASALEELATEYAQVGMQLSQAQASLAAATLRAAPVPGWIGEQALVNGWNDVARQADGKGAPYPSHSGVLL